MERGLPTAQATRIAKSWTSAIACAFRPIIQVTRCAACGSATKKTKAITKVFRMKDCGRSRTMRTRVPSFVRRTGCNIKKSIAALRTQSCRKWREPNRRYFSRRIITSRCCRGWSRMPDLTRAWRSSGTFPGRTRKFLETVDRAVEALTEWDRFAVNRQGHITRVRPYPISVAFPENSHAVKESRNSGEERAALGAEMHIEASLLGGGVDRVDYTKGILE